VTKGFFFKKDLGVFAKKLIFQPIVTQKKTLTNLAIA
jgi:hypothetical protein